MAYDESIEKKITGLYKGKRLVSRRMFGGVCYLYRGNMAFGIYKDNIIVRLGSSELAEKLIGSGKALAFDITGKAMKGWVMVPKARLRSTGDYRRWLDQGLAFARSLPVK